MMKAILRLFMAVSLLLAATSSYAWFGNDNGWGGNSWNPYDEWDPRYWMEEMEDIWDDDDDYYGGGYGPGYGYGGPGYGYGGPGYGYGGPGYGGYAPAPYGYAPAPQQQYAPAPQQQYAPAPQQQYAPR
jgi:hypothetical protein